LAFGVACLSGNGDAFAVSVRKRPAALLAPDRCGNGGAFAVSVCRQLATLLAPDLSGLDYAIEYPHA